MKAEFIGKNGHIPLQGGTPGAWTVGKIYDLSWTDTYTVGVKKDDRGRENGWNKEYFRIVSENEEIQFSREQKILDLLNFLWYLRREKPTELWGGVRIEKAWKAALHFTGIPEHLAEKIFGKE